jgi:serine O-acetyltransferase
MTSSSLPSVWLQLCEELQDAATAEPLWAEVRARYVSPYTNFADSLAQVLTDRLSCGFCAGQAQSALFATFTAAHAQAPQIVLSAEQDLRASVKQDPTAEQLHPCLFFSKGFQALQVHRTAHWYWQQKQHFTANTLASACCAALSIDIHPAAKIGAEVFLAHADGIVIGATAHVGDRVTLLHGVTLGAKLGMQGVRHPNLQDGVVVGANASILGPVQIGARSQIGSGAVVVKDVPSDAIATGVPARSRLKN